jgi:hypothetical protein
MPAAKYNIVIDQHADFNRVFQVKVGTDPVDLTDHSFTASVREKIQSSTAYNFTVTVTDVAEGLIRMSMTDTETGAIPAGDYVYDLVMLDDLGLKTRLLEGQAQVSGGVTR